MFQHLFCFLVKNKEEQHWFLSFAIFRKFVFVTLRIAF